MNEAAYAYFSGASDKFFQASPVPDLQTQGQMCKVVREKGNVVFKLICHKIGISLGVSLRLGVALLGELFAELWSIVGNMIIEDRVVLGEDKANEIYRVIVNFLAIG